MDLKKILTTSTKDLQNDNKKAEIFKELCLIKLSDKSDSKMLLKLFDLTQIILRFKGEQVSILITEIDKLAKKQGEQESLENVTVWSDGSKHSNKTRIIESDLFRENEDRNESLEDSLSEIDRKRDMLNNINSKNKHIKKLFHEIKQLKKKLNEQNKNMATMKSELVETKQNLNVIERQYTEANDTIIEKENVIIELSIKIREFEENFQSQILQNEEREKQIEEFTQHIKTRALIWKNLIQEKNNLPNFKISEDELDQTDTEKDKILEALKVENGANITDLKEKLEGLIKEVADSLISVREASSASNANLPENNLNELLQRQLQKYRQRCIDMETLFENSENDIVARSEQTLKTNNTLHALQTDEKSLTKALLKITELNRKLNVRDNHIKELIGELNSGQQNQSLNDVPMSPVKKSPIKLHVTNARLLLTMNATDDLRLQLKLEKCTNK